MSRPGEDREQTSVDYATADSTPWQEGPSVYCGPSPANDAADLPALHFDAVYSAHFDYVCSTLRRRGVHEQDLHDLAQQVFIVVHLKLAEFEHRAALRTWIFRICVNVVSDYRRAAPKRKEVATEPAELNSLFGSRDDLQERSDERRRVGLAEGMLNRLPKARREVFVLCELEQMSGAEVASALGIALGTVRSRLRLARDFLAREAHRLSARESSKKGRAG